MRRNKNKINKEKILFIDARNLGHMIDRKVRELSEEDIQKIAKTYHSWRKNENYMDVAGFCKSATKEEIKENNYVLTPGRYVGVEEIKEDGIPFGEKMKKLTNDLFQQMEEAVKLDEEIKKILNELKF